MGIDIYMFAFVIATLCGFAILAYFGDKLMKKIEQSDHSLGAKIDMAKKIIMNKFGR